MKLYVGNLPYNISDDQLRDVFARFGTPESARVITDRDSGQSKGFGFVEFSDDEQAKAALPRTSTPRETSRPISRTGARTVRTSWISSRVSRIRLRPRSLSF